MLMHFSAGIMLSYFGNLQKPVDFFFISGYNNLAKGIDASVAQSVVHLTRNEKVACSSHVTSSIASPGIVLMPGDFFAFIQFAGTILYCSVPIPEGSVGCYPLPAPSFDGKSVLLEF